MRNDRATRIVATIGPASSQASVLRAMILAGADVVRLNMSHGSQAEHARAMELARGAAARLRQPVGILVDLQGPKVRTGRNEGGNPLRLCRGEIHRIETQGRGRGSAPGRIVVDTPALARSVSPGSRVLIDDGKILLRVMQKSRGILRVRVLRGGTLRERAGVNVPGPVAGLRAPTPKDRRDAAFAVRQGADFVALSFVQTAQDVRRLRRLLEREARALRGGFAPLVIAKLEKPVALEHLDDILAESDGVMVARGDLGVELSLEKVPLWQKEILRRARASGVFTITATEMLQSMVRSSVPTRAEASDVANAVLDGTDALMLSAETAIGDHPIESVRMLGRLAAEADRVWREPSAAGLRMTASGQRVAMGSVTVTAGGSRAASAESGDPVEALARAAADLAADAGARWIVAFTLSGRTARLIARHRPAVPILALTPSDATRRRLMLNWNTRSLGLPRSPSVDEMLRSGLRLLRRERLVREGDRILAVAGAADPPEATNLLRLVVVRE